METLKHSALATYVKLQVRAQDAAAKHAKPPAPATPTSPTDDSEEGSTTVEYDIGAVATAAFAGLLLAVLKSGGVKQMLNNIIQTALSM